MCLIICYLLGEFDGYSFVWLFVIFIEFVWIFNFGWLCLGVCSCLLSLFKYGNLGINFSIYIK